jgi:hypothetical protein
MTDKPTTYTHGDWRVELPSDAVTKSAQSGQQSPAVLVGYGMTPN